jgi:O-antigen/teichoic acid export membrane protein
MQEISNLFYAFKDLKAYAFKEIILQVTRLLLIIIIFTIPETLISSSPLIFAVIASIFGSIFSILILSKKYEKLFNSKKSKIDLRELFNYIKFLSLGSLSVLFLVYTDILLLGYFASSETVGFYKAASSLALFLSSAFIFTTIIYPFFTQIKDLKRLNNLVNITLKYILMISIPLTFGTIITARYFVRAIFGYSYLDSSYILYVLAFLIFLLPVGELFKVFLNSKGKSEKTAKIILFSSILNIILNLFFIFYFIDKSVLYASMGVALSTVIARLIILLNLIIISKREFGIKIDSSIFLKPLIASSFMSAFLYSFTRIIYGEATLFLISFEILTGIVIYFLSLYLIKGISKKDFMYIKDLVRDTINARKK